MRFISTDQRDDFFAIVANALGSQETNDKLHCFAFLGIKSSKTAEGLGTVFVECSCSSDVLAVIFYSEFGTIVSGSRLDESTAIANARRCYEDVTGALKKRGWRVNMARLLTILSQGGS